MKISKAKTVAAPACNNTTHVTTTTTTRSHFLHLIPDSPACDVAFSQEGYRWSADQLERPHLVPGAQVELLPLREEGQAEVVFRLGSDALPVAVLDGAFDGCHLCCKGQVQLAHVGLPRDGRGALEAALEASLQG